MDKNGLFQEAGDAELLARSQRGEIEAFATLVQRYQGRAYRLAYQLVMNHEDALDIAQEAFARAYNGLPGFKGKSSFYTWLYRIVINLALDLLRERGPQGEMPVEGQESIFQTVSPVPDPGQIMEARELSSQIQKALAELPLPQRTVVILKDLEGLSYQDIARSVGCSLGTVMSRLHYGRKRLRELLEPFLEGGHAK